MTDADVDDLVVQLDHLTEGYRAFASRWNGRVGDEDVTAAQSQRLQAAAERFADAVDAANLFSD